MTNQNQRTGRIGNTGVSPRSSAAGSAVVRAGNRMPAALNAPMSRGQFVRTVGIGAAALGMAATGLGGVARAARPQSVYPTGNYPADLVAVQNAVNNGGTVILKSADVSGVPTAFNFGVGTAQNEIGSVLISNDVTILGEAPAPGYSSIILPNGTTKEYAEAALPNGGMINPGTVIFGGGFIGGVYDADGHPLQPPRGAFTVMAKKHFEISNLWFVNSQGIALAALAGDGSHRPCKISGNKFDDSEGKQWAVMPEGFLERDLIWIDEQCLFGQDTFSGELLIENNQLDFPPVPVWANEAANVGVYFMTYSPAMFTIRNNNIFNFHNAICCYGPKVYTFFSGCSVQPNESILRIEGNLEDVKDTQQWSGVNLFCDYQGVYFAGNKTLRCGDLVELLADSDDAQIIDNEFIAPPGGTWCLIMGFSNADNALISGNYIVGSFGLGIWPTNSFGELPGPQGWIIERNYFGMTRDGQKLGTSQGAVYLQAPNCVVKNNKFFNLQPYWLPGAIYCQNTVNGQNGNNKLVGNDYTQSGLPGWKDPVNPMGCVLLDVGTTEILVAEIGRWPAGTSVCDQVLDLTDDPTTDKYDGTNKIIGWNLMCYRLSAEQRQRLIALRDRLRVMSQERMQDIREMESRFGSRVDSFHR